ncbi:hypothetical protein [Micrococcus sp.]|uniref:hypothetical protein n=1 Tax=Micrococcus sp. TaxID=1271 RepID=UPI002A919695|nr:hypothetical protein [Micrococcus sp.]MDY6054532.1 hypothetical protein [Micrococcus sp.]
MAPAVPEGGWAYARGRLRSGAALEVRYSGGGMIDVVVDGITVNTDFPWDGPVGDKAPEGVLAESLGEMLPALGEMTYAVEASGPPSSTKSPSESP